MQFEQPSGHRKWYNGHMEQGCKIVVVMVVVTLVVVVLRDVVVEVAVVVVVVVVVDVVPAGLLLVRVVRVVLDAGACPCPA